MSEGKAGLWLNSTLTLHTDSVGLPADAVLCGIIVQSANSNYSVSIHLRCFGIVRLVTKGIVIHVRGFIKINLHIINNLYLTVLPGSLELTVIINY